MSKTSQQPHAKSYSAHQNYTYGNDSPASAPLSPPRRVTFNELVSVGYTYANVDYNRKPIYVSPPSLEDILEIQEMRQAFHKETFRLQREGSSPERAFKDGTWQLKVLHSSRIPVGEKRLQNIFLTVAPSSSSSLSQVFV